MNPEQDDDAVLDACLSEVLGGHAPPDLSARIVGHDGQLIARKNNQVLAAMPAVPPVVARPPMLHMPGESAGAKSGAKRADRWSITALVAVAAGVIGVFVAI